MALPESQQRRNQGVSELPSSLFGPERSDRAWPEAVGRRGPVLTGMDLLRSFWGGLKGLWLGLEGLNLTPVCSSMTLAISA
jgi:hypothetical protein